MPKTAVCVTALNRPEYTERVIESLEAQPDKDEVDWWLFQGGAVNRYSGLRHAEDETIERSLAVLMDADLPNKHLRVNDENIGIALQRDRIFHLLDEEYDRLIHLEGDIVVGKYWLRLSRKLMDQFPFHIGRMYRLHDPSEHDINPRECLDEVLITDHGNHVADCITKTVWEEIRDDWHDFVDIIRGYDFPRTEVPREELAERFVPGVYGDDHALSHIARKNDVNRVIPRVSRASDIGALGMTHTPENRAGTARGNEGDLTYEADADIEEFTVYDRAFIRDEDDWRL
ncbi:glycosyltransferase family 2 protein [Halorussus sp. MSC15.2]|uniref:glycosyltransferase family 2 protein n=1 Tax=Halorussus sp. MSC15.2 TaxID=2283638 RepID=UPI0013D7F97C|nr:glycosyltransferase family 2 protein [Halorussus sp. MSC15.2]NEU58609.1 glycosyltransferase family 2 protein [Halorussus sp. MSC15.2]